MCKVVNREPRFLLLLLSPFSPVAFVAVLLLLLLLLPLLSILPHGFMLLEGESRGGGGDAGRGIFRNGGNDTTCKAQVSS